MCRWCSLWNGCWMQVILSVECIMTSTIVRQAKRNAIVGSRQWGDCPSGKYCGQPIPGRRHPNQASSSPTALAMYLSTTPTTGATQSTRTPPPSGYSNTVCCGEGNSGRDLPKIEPAVVAGGFSCGGPMTRVQSSTYRGRGTIPKRNWQPSQLASWRMSPAPNRMERIGNVRPPPSEPRSQIVSKRPSVMSASEHITEVRDEAIVLLNTESGYCKQSTCTTDIVITHDGISEKQCRITSTCPRPPQTNRFAGTGLQRYTTADLPLLVKCPPSILKNPECPHDC